MANNNVISFEHSAEQAHKRLRGQQLKQIAEGVRERLEQTLPHLMQELFDRVDDEFYTLSDRSGTGALQNRYFDAMRQIRRVRQAIGQGFLQELLSQLDRFWGDPESYLSGAARPDIAATDGENGMSLLEEDDLEESLAISSMASKTCSRFHQTLYALNKRLAFLVGLEELPETGSPLAPRAFAEAFAKGLSAWEGDTVSRLVVYKLFERHVMTYVGGLYDEINDFLVENDILPKISRRIQRSPVAPSVQRARDPDSEQAAPIEGTLSLDDALLRELAMLVASRRGEDAQSATYWYDRSASSLHLPQVSTRELIGALGSIQQVSLNQAPIDIESLREMQAELMQSLGKELDVGSLEKPIKRLGDIDRNLLDVMGMLFDFILDDENLPESMKALLGRLQIPLLKIGLQDRRFFNDREHPARKLLNTLARAALAWTDDGDRSRNSTYGQIEAAVMRVLTDFERNVDVFEEVHRHFNAYLEREQRNANVAEKRLVQARDGQENLQQAKIKVSEQIEVLIRECSQPDCQVPGVVETILTTGWRDVMLLILLREGEQSEAWGRAAEVARKVIWSVQPKPEVAERQRLLKAIPDLLKQLKEGLNNISYDQHAASVMLKELQACHIAALRGASLAASKTPARNQQKPSPKTTPSPERKSEPEDEFHQAARDIPIGNWVEWTGDEGRRVRGKLSWRSQISGGCVFVDRRGIKLAEMSLDGIAGLLRCGNARTIEGMDSPLMDKALDAMMGALQRTAPENRPT